MIDNIWIQVTTKVRARDDNNFRVWSRDFIRAEDLDMHIQNMIKQYNIKDMGIDLSRWEKDIRFEIKVTDYTGDIS